MCDKTVSITNPARVYSLDFARGAAVFFMIMQHAMIMLEKTEGEGNTIIGNVFILLGTAPAAPIFIFIMGVFLVKSTKNVKQNIMRGIKLFFFGYLFNLLRFTLPLFLVGISKCFAQNKLGNSQEIIDYSLYMLFTVDIFQLAGLSLIFFSPLKKLAANKYIFPVLIIIILFVSPYLWGNKDNLLILTPLWGAIESTDFPVFPWCIYFLLGMYLSKYFQTQNMEKSFKKRIIIAGLMIAAIGIATIGVFPLGDYYRSGLSIHFLMISFLFLWLPICDYIVAKLSKKGFKWIVNTIYFWSSNVTGIYVVQWIIYGWSIIIIEPNSMVDYLAMMIGFMVVIISHILFKYTKVKRLMPKL